MKKLLILLSTPLFACDVDPKKVKIPPPPATQYHTLVPTPATVRKQQLDEVRKQLMSALVKKK